MPEKDKSGLVLTPDYSDKNAPATSSIQFEDKNIGKNNAKYGYDQFVDFSKYNSIYQNVEEVADMNQSAGNKIGRALYKSGAIAGATFVDGTAGFIAGVINAAYQGIKTGTANSLYSDFIDNPFSQGGQSFQNRIEDENRLFVGSDEASKDWYQRLGSANFWGDNVIKNAGFAIGALAAGALTAGVGAEVSGLNTLMKESKVLNALGKISAATGDEAQAYKYLLNPEKLKGLASESVIKEITEAGKAIRIKSGINQVISNSFSTIAEARSEALQNGNDFYKDQYSKLVVEYGGESNIPQSEVDNLAERTTNYKNSVFTTNLPILFTSNAIEFKNVFSSGLKQNKNILNSFIKETGQISSPLKYAPTTAEKIFQYGKAALKNPLSEMTEEQLQYAVSEGNKSYFDRVNNDESKHSLLGGLAATINGLQKAYGTAEGWENGVIGAFFGAVGMPSVKTYTTKGGTKFIAPTIAGGIKDDIQTLNRQQKDTKALVEFANKHINDSKFKTLFDFAVVDGSIQIDKTKAQEAGDDLIHKNLEKEQLINMVEAYSDLGKMEEFHNRLNEEKDLSPDELRKKYSIQQETKEKDAEGKPIIKNVDIFSHLTDDELVKHISNKADTTYKEAQKIATVKKSVQDRFPNLPEGQQKDLTRLAVMQENVDSRMIQLGEEIKTATSETNFKNDVKNFNTDVNDIHTEETPNWSNFTTALDWNSMYTHKGAYNKFMDDINKFVKDNPTQLDIAEKAKDLVRLSALRNKFKVEYVKALNPTYQIDKEKEDTLKAEDVITKKENAEKGTLDDRNLYNQVTAKSDEHGFKGGIVEILHDNGIVGQYQFNEGDPTELHNVDGSNSKITNEHARKALANGKANIISGTQQLTQIKNEVEVRKYNARIESLRALIAEKDEALKTFAETQLGEISTEIEALEKELTELSKLIQDREANKRNKQEKTQKFINKAFEIMEKLDTLKQEKTDRREAIIADTEYIINDRKTLIDELDKTKENLKKAEEDNKRYKEVSFTFAEALSKQAEEKHQRLQEQIDTLEQELKEVDNYIDGSFATQQVLDKQIENIRNTIASLKNTIKKLTSSLDKSLQELSLDELWNFLTDRNAPVTAKVKEDLDKFFGEFFSTENKIVELELELKQLENIRDKEKLDDLKLQQALNSRLFEAQVERYEKELNRIEREYLSSISVTKEHEAKGVVETFDGEIPTEGKAKDIEHVFSSTTSNDGNNENEVNSDISKNAFFRWVENVAFGIKDNFKLMTVTISDPVYGVGQEKDIFKDDYNHDENDIRLIAVTSKGVPMTYGGKVAYASLPTESTTWQNDDERFSIKNKKLTEEEKKILIEQHQTQHIAFRDKIKANPKVNHYVDVTEVHRGTIINKNNTLYSLVGSLFAKSSDAKIYVTTSKDGKVSIDGRDIDYPIGVPYVSFGKTFASLNVRKVNTEEINTVVGLIKTFMSNYTNAKGTIENKREEANKGGLPISLTTAIKNIIYFSDKSALPISFTYLNNGGISLNINGEEISSEDVLNGTMDNMIKDFLAKKQVQINNTYLNKNHKHYEIGLTAGKPVVKKEWSSYNQYLIDGDSNAILTTRIQPKTETSEEDRLKGEGRRFQNGYVVFDNNPDKLRTTLKTIVPNTYKESTEISDNNKTYTYSDSEGGKYNVTIKDGKIAISDLKGVINEEINTLLQEILNNEGVEGVIQLMSENGKLIETTVIKTVISQPVIGLPIMTVPTALNEDLEKLEAEQLEEGIVETPIEIVNPDETSIREEEGFGEIPVISIEDIKDNEVNRTLITSEKPIYLEKELSWLETVLPQAEYKRVKGLIAQGVIGRVTRKGSILISELATEGTVYHEAWHYVSQFLLNKSELSGLYSEWKTRNNKLDASNKEVEEAIAEEFRDYMLGEKPKSTKQKTWFDKLISAVKGILGISDKINSNSINRINGMFARIADGEFANKDKVNEQLDYDFLNKEGGVEWFKNIDVMQAIHSNFINELVRNPKNLFTVNFNSPESKLIYQKIYNALKGQLRAYLKVSGREDLLPLIKKYILDRTSLSATEVNKLNNDLQIISLKYTKNPVGLINLVALLNVNYFNDAIQEYKNFVTQFGIDVKESTEDIIIDSEKTNEEIKEEEIRLEQTKSGSESRFEESFYKSPKEGVEQAIKLLISGLSEYKENGSAKINPKTGMQQTVNYNNTMNSIQNYLADSINYQDMLNKLKNSTNITFNKLGEYLGNREGKDYYSLKLQIAFSGQFDKSNENFHQLLINPNQEYNFDDGNYQKLTRRIKDDWTQTIRKSSFVHARQGRYIVKEELLQRKTDKKEDKIKFLQDLGVTFSDSSEVSGSGMKEIIDAVKANPDITDIFNSTESGRWKNLIKEESELREDISDNQHYTPSGKTAYNIVNNNFITKLLNKFKKGEVGIPSYLTNDPYAKGSILLDRIKNGQTIKKAILEGLKVANKTGENVETSKASLGDYLINFVTATLDGKFPLLITGDKKTNNGFETDLFLPVNKDTNTETVVSDLVDQLYKYFQVELEMSTKRKLESTYIKGEEKLKSRVLFNEHIVGKNLSDEKDVKANITKFVNEVIKSNIKMLQDNNLINGNTTYFDKRQLKKITGKDDKLTSEDITKFVTAFTANNMISAIEQTKVFFGNPVYYKDVVDMFKRFSGFVARTTPLSNDSALNSAMDIVIPREDGKRTGNINVIVFEDVTAINEELKSLGYSGFEEADAYSMILEDDYRDLHFKSSLWTDRMEAEHQAQLKGETTNYPLNPIKPIIAGTQSEDSFKPFYCKTATIRLSKYLVDQVKSPILSSLYKEMKDNGVGFAVFTTGNKVGTTINKVDKKAQSFYNEDGSIATINPELIVSVNLDNMGIQVENKPTNTIKQSVTAGTQAPAIIMGNLFENGTSKNIEVKREGEWKEVDSKIIVDEISYIQNEITKVERENLEKEIGLKETTVGYRFGEGAKELRDRIISQARDRGANENLITSIRLAFASKNIMLDGVVDKDKIQNILSSIVENTVFKQSRFGKALVQFPDTGFELEKRTKIAENFAQGRLKTYGLDKDSNVTQIMLPYIYKNIFGKGNKIKISDIKDPRLLRFLGFRIPTEQLNSIDILEIADFLPESVGNLVVVATGITVKVGSDFDFDKLNMYFPHFTVDPISNTPIYVEYNDTNLNNPELKLKALQNRLIELNMDIVGSPTNRQALITPNSIDHIKEIAKSLGWIEKQQHPYNFIMQFFKIADIQNKFWTGKDLIGIFALHNKNHIISQIAGLKLKKEYTDNKEDVINTKMNFVGIKQNEDGSYDLGHIYALDEQGNKTTVTISSELGQLLSTMVDVTKNPELLHSLNLNKETANVAALLIRLGLPLETVFQFITQPSIVEYIKEVNNANSKFYSFNKDKFEDSKSKIAEKLLAKYKVGYSIPLNQEKLSGKSNAIQGQVLSDFLRYYEIGQTLSNFQSALSFDTASFKNISEVKQQLEDYNNVMKINAFDNVNKYEATYLAGFKDSLMKTKEYFKSLLYTEKNEKVEKTATGLKNIFTKNIFNKNKLSRVHSIIDNNIIASILTTTEYNNDRIIDKFDYLFKGINSVPSRLKEYFASVPSNTLAVELSPLFNNEGKGVDNLRLYNRKMTSWQQQELTNDFAEMGQKDSILLEDLIKFALIQNGLTKNSYSFLHLFPATAYHKIVKTLLLVNSSSSIEFNSNQFIEDFYKNNYSNNDIVPYVPFSIDKWDNLLNKRTFTLNAKNRKAKYDYLKVSVDNELFIFKGQGIIDGNRIYTLTSKRGNDKNSNEFGLSKSNIASNNVVLAISKTNNPKISEITQQWNDNKDKIIAKHPTATEEKWNSLTDTQRKNLIKCL